VIAITRSTHFTRNQTKQSNQYIPRNPNKTRISQNPIISHLDTKNKKIDFSILPQPDQPAYCTLVLAFGMRQLIAALNGRREEV